MSDSPRPRVFGAGLPRTGTDTLRKQVALNILGLGPTYHMYELLNGEVGRAKEWRAALIEIDRAERAGEQPQVDFPVLLDGFYSGVDCPISDSYMYFARAFPDSKVVLTRRDPDKWMTSSRATILKVEQRLYGLIVYWVPILYWQRRLWMDGGVRLYERRYGGYTEKAMELRTAEAKALIPADRLLIFQVQDGWEPLCKFLGVPVPSVPFPSGNDTAELNRYLGMMIQRGLKRWMLVLTTTVAAVAIGMRYRLKA